MLKIHALNCPDLAGRVTSTGLYVVGPQQRTLDAEACKVRKMIVDKLTLAAYTTMFSQFRSVLTRRKQASKSFGTQVDGVHSTDVDNSRTDKSRHTVADGL